MCNTMLAAYSKADTHFDVCCRLCFDSRYGTHWLEASPWSGCLWARRSQLFSMKLRITQLVVAGSYTLATRILQSDSAQLQGMHREMFVGLSKLQRD